MAEKISKTARASMGDKGERQQTPCPSCGTSMVATRVVRFRDIPGGMYWVCPKDDTRLRV